MHPVGMGMRIFRLIGVMAFAAVVGAAISAAVFGPRQLSCLYQELQLGPAGTGTPCLKLTDQQAQAYMLRRMGDAYWQQNRVAEAALAYKRGARIDATIGDQLYAAGNQAMAMGNIATGIAYLTAYVDIPNVPKDKLYHARNLRRFAWEQQEKLTDALATFSESMGVAQARVASTMPRTSEVKERWVEDALRELKVAIELAPQNDVAYWQRAGLRFDLGDLPGALADSEAALRIDPAKWQNVSRRATVLARVRKSDEAIMLLDAFEAQAGKAAQTERLRGEILANGGKLKPAKAALDRAIDLADTDGEAYWMRGRINAQLGDLDAAIADTLKSKALGFTGAQAWVDAYVAQRNMRRSP